MNRSSHTPISDELLSAYIDGLVTNEEKARVEAAVAADPALAWELDSLRRTVELVRDLPPVPLPRSFILREEQVADVLAERRVRNLTPATPRPHQAPRPQAAAPRAGGFWREFLAFFNSGNLFLRNATAMAALLLIVVIAISEPAALRPTNLPRTTEQTALVAASEPQSEEPATFASQADSASAPESAAKAAPATQSAVSTESLPEAPAPQAEAPAPQPAPMQAASVAMESASPPPSVMRSSGGDLPLGMDAPALVGPSDGIGGGFESGPMARSIAPDDTMAPVGESSFSAAGAGGPPQADAPPYAAEQAVEGIASGPALVEPAVSESAANGSAVEENVALDSAEKEAAEKEVVMVEPEMQAQKEIQTEPLSQELLPQESLQSGWPIWLLAQVALGGLVLLLGLLWLRSRRTSL